MLAIAKSDLDQWGDSAQPIGVIDLAAPFPDTIGRTVGGVSRGRLEYNGKHYQTRPGSLPAYSSWVEIAEYIPDPSPERPADPFQDDFSGGNAGR